LVVGCGYYQRYAPSPLPADATTSAAAFRARSLDDSTLRVFLTRAGAAPSGGMWSARQLALAAAFQRGDVTVARASVAEARAAEATAGLRPASSVSGSVERASSADEGKSSPWTLSLATGLTFETAGKRGARAARARAATLAARLRVAVAGWDAAQEAAQAAAAIQEADQDLIDAEAEATAVREVLGLVRARYAEGRVSVADVAQGESDVRAATLGVVQARRAQVDARVALARALALPVTATEGLSVRTSAGPGACAVAAATHADSLQSLALQHRFDLGSALADYAVAEVDLRIEVAGQYPDLTIAPGLAWDQGVRRWTLGLGTPGIPAARNRGPIGQARARREAHAARVRVAQDSALADVDAALAGCRSADAGIAASDSVRAATARSVSLADAADARGETGRTEVALARLALVRAERGARQAAARRATADVAVESAVGAWLTDSPRAWPAFFDDDIPRDDAHHDRR
jgi:outer membrane protein, heavy metal efflux system